MQAPVRRAAVSLMAVLAAFLVFTAPAAGLGGCYTCQGQCPTSQSDGELLCSEYCGPEYSYEGCGEEGSGCDGFEHAPDQINCWALSAS